MVQEHGKVDKAQHRGNSRQGAVAWKKERLGAIVWKEEKCHSSAKK